MNFLEEMRARKRRGDGVNLSRLLGIDETAVGLIFKGKRAIKADELPKIAQYYGISGYSGSLKKVRIDGIVGAGSEVFPIDDGLDDVEAPPGVSDHARALLVKGDSMIPAYYDGDVVIYDNPLPWADASRYAGEECVVATNDGRRALKVLIPTKDVRLWTLHSYNAEPWVDVLLDWAAPVVWAKRAPRKLRRTLGVPQAENVEAQQGVVKRSRKT